MKKMLACGLMAMAVFGLSAETVTIDPGAGVAVSPAKITGSKDVDVFSGIVTMDPSNDYAGTTRITNGTLIASKLASAGNASSVGSSGLVDVGNAIFRYTGSEAVTMDRVFTNSVSKLASTGTVEVVDLHGDVTFTKRFTTGYMPFAKTGPGAMIVNNGGHVMPLQSGNGYQTSKTLTPNALAEFPADGTSPTVGLTPPFTLLDGSLIIRGGRFNVSQTACGTILGAWAAGYGEEEKDVFVTLDGGTANFSTKSVLGHMHGFADYNTPNGPAKAYVTINDGSTLTQSGGQSFIIGSQQDAPSVKINGATTALTYNSDLRFTVNPGGEFTHGDSYSGFQVLQQPGQKSAVTVDGGKFRANRILIGAKSVKDDTTALADIDIKNGGSFRCESFTNNVNNRANPPAVTVRVTSGAQFQCDSMANCGSGNLNFYLDGCTLCDFGLNGRYLNVRKTVMCAEATSVQLGTNAVTLLSKGKYSSNPIIAVFAAPFTSSSELTASGCADGGVVVSGETPSNTVEFAAAMAYTGPTVVKSGVLAFSGSGAIPATTHLVMDGGTLLLDGNRTMTVGSIEAGLEKSTLALGPGGVLTVTGDVAFDGTIAFKFFDASGAEIETAVTRHPVLTVSDEHAAAVRAARFAVVSGRLTVAALSLESNGDGTSTLYVNAVPSSVLSFTSDFSESKISIDAGFVVNCSSSGLADGTHTVATFSKTADETYIGGFADFAMEWKSTELTESATETEGVWAISLVIASGDSPTGVWIPVGAGGSWSAAANWTGTVPNGVGMTAEFPEASAAGVPVNVDGDVTLGAIRFQSGTTAGGYRLSGGGSLALDSNVVEDAPKRGVEIAAVDGAAAHVCDIATPVTAEWKQNWAIPEGQTLVLEKGVTAPELTISSGSTTVGGTTVLGGTNVIDGRLVLSNGLVVITGKITSSAGIDETVATEDGETAAYVRFANNETAAYLTLSNAVIEKPTFIFVGMSSDPRKWWHVSTASTNVFAADLYYCNKSGTIHFDGPGARLEIVGGGRSSYSMTGGGSPQDTEVYVGKKPFAFTCFKVGYKQTFILDVPGVEFTSRSNPIGLLMNSSDAKVDFRVSYAMSGIINGNGQTGGFYEFNTTTQSIATVLNVHNSTFNGTYPAMCEIVEGYPASEAGTGAHTIRCKVTGGLGFTMSGPDAICLSNRVFESHGDIAVTDGLMEFASNASWPNGTNVTVAGSGTLKLNSSTAFNPEHAVIRFADDGKMELPQGVTQVFAQGWDEDESLTPGMTYTASNLPSRISGAGAIRIAGGGTLMIIR